MAGYCPCAQAGCYMECEIEETCWIDSIADSLTDYEPKFTSAPTTATSTPTAAPGCSQNQNDLFFFQTPYQEKNSIQKL